MADFAPTVPRLDATVFAIFCTDGPDAARLRDEHMEDHLLYTEKNCDRYLVAGPMRPTDSAALNGSLFLIIADTEDEAWDIANGDPYFQSGVYAAKDMRVFTPAVGRLLGGVIWDSADALKRQMAESPASDARPAGASP